MKVIGIGDNVVDMYLSEKKMYLGGNALNFAVFANRLGIDSAFVGVFGNDQRASFALDVLNQLNVDTSHSKAVPGENGFSRVELLNGDRRFLGSNRGGVLREGLNINVYDIDFINGFDLAHFNINGSADEYLDLVKIPKVYDFSDKFTDEVIVQVADKVDLACFSCGGMSKGDVESLCHFVEKAGCDSVLCTLGSQGSVFYSNGLFYWQDAVRVKAVDTMGAGDAFITAFSIEWVQKTHSIEESMIKARDFATEQVMTNGSFGFGRSF